MFVIISVVFCKSGLLFYLYISLYCVLYIISGLIRGVDNLLVFSRFSSASEIWPDKKGVVFDEMGLIRGSLS